MGPGLSIQPQRKAGPALREIEKSTLALPSSTLVSSIMPQPATHAEPVHNAMPWVSNVYAINR